MSYEIEFEDQGQDLLRLQVNETTGLIEKAEPFHNDLYGNGDFFVVLADLHKHRSVIYLRRNEKAGKQYTFKWPMVLLKRGGKVIRRADDTPVWQHGALSKRTDGEIQQLTAQMVRDGFGADANSRQGMIQSLEKARAEYEIADTPPDQKGHPALSKATG